MDSKEKNSDFNPYDLNQVSQRRNRLKVVRIRSYSNDPYFMSSSMYRQKRVKK